MGGGGDMGIYGGIRKRKAVTCPMCTIPCRRVLDICRPIYIVHKPFLTVCNSFENLGDTRSEFPGYAQSL